MTNYIVNERLEVSGDLTINGMLIVIANKDGLNKVENLDTYVPISGKVNQLNAQNLILCEYKNCELITLGSSIFMEKITYE